MISPVRELASLSEHMEPMAGNNSRIYGSGQTDFIEVRALLPFELLVGLFPQQSPSQLRAFVSQLPTWRVLR